MVRYFVISKVKDTFYALSDERRMVLWGGAIDYVDRLIKEHKFKDVQHMPGWNQTVFIVEVESAEEATKLAVENPMHDYTEIQSYPIVEWGVYINEMRSAFQQLAARR